MKPNPKYGLTTTVLDDTEPTTVAQTIKNSLSLQAMHEEYQALFLNHTWDLVPSNPRHNLIGNKWVFRIKCHSNDSITLYKACLVAIEVISNNTSLYRVVELYSFTIKMRTCTIRTTMIGEAIHLCCINSDMNM